MPIRSSRGRAAAYRGVWQWPLRSPARLAVTVAVLVALAAGASYGLGGVPARGAGEGPGPATSARPSGGPSSSPGALPPGMGQATPELRPEDAPQAALVTATRWANAWVRPPEGTSAREWLADLEPTTTEAYLGLLATVDPGNNPATRVTGAARAVRAAERAVEVEVPTDALTLLVTVVETERGWQVANHERV